MADHSRVLLLSVHAALGSRRDDAAARGCFRPHRDGRRVDGRPLLLCLFTVQPDRRRGDGQDRAAPGDSNRRGNGRCRGAALRVGQQRGGEHRPLPAGRRGRLRADRRRLHCDHELPGVARRDAHRRHPDVRHGRRIGRPVPRRAGDRVRRPVEHVLDRDGRRRSRHQRGVVVSCRRRRRKRRPADCAAPRRR